MARAAKPRTRGASARAAFRITDASCNGSVLTGDPGTPQELAYQPEL
jgi:hypothetical protein